MARYDANVIVQFAQALYEQANLTLFFFTLGGVAIGGGGGWLLSTEAAVAGAIIFGGIGYLIGQTRAFQLKLQAQLALCQVEIEENTRKLSGGMTPVNQEIAAAVNAHAQSAYASPTPSSVVKPISVTAPAPASGSGRKCRDCGAELPRNAEFCPKCLVSVR